ncbi:MAG: metallophosphoesterase [Thermoplasmata archaeon]|nr:MAG: metallophosphoesterase [Thermoplasmata archaeon]
MVTIAHISDIHCSKTRHGRTGFKPEQLNAGLREVNKLNPDVVVITGDLTMFGFKEEYKMARKYISRIESETLIIPGNHDSRYCGYEYFDEYFGYGNISLKFPNISIIGIDTTIPDLDEGNVGRGKLRWLIGNIKKMPKKNFKLVAMHHHLIPIPHTGRERADITDGGTVLKAMINAGVHMVLCGHKHTPNTWLINNLAIVNAGSVSATKLRANTRNSYNIIEIENNSIDIYLKEIGRKPKPMANLTKTNFGSGLMFGDQ